MSDENQSPEDASTYGTDAGMPVEQSELQPSEAELDERDRLMSRPRRSQGPPLYEDAEASALASLAEPGPATDPMSAETHAVPGYATYTSDAGRPAEHSGPKPSHDELDRRDRLMAGVRRPQGPPLRDDRREEALREEAAHEPVAATDPKEP
jgi:hypothetical protein